VTTWRRKTGDVGDTVRVGVHGIADIADAIIEGHVQRGGTSYNLAGIIIKPVADDDGPCVVELALGGVDGLPWLPIAATGTWALETELTFPGRVLTWPEVGNDTIVVERQLDP